MKIKHLFGIVFVCLLTTGCSFWAELTSEPEKEPEANIVVFGEIAEEYNSTTVVFKGMVQNIGNATGRFILTRITLFRNDIRLTSSTALIANGDILLPGEKGIFEISFALDNPHTDYDRWEISFDFVTVKEFP